VSHQLPLLVDRISQPSYCQYVEGPCDQDFWTATAVDAFFVYPSQPTSIASAVEGAAERLRARDASKRFLTWKGLNPDGQMIFCVISKTLRFAGAVVADVSTLNFNVLFEIGYAIGLGVPVIPIRDTSYIKDEKAFDALGVLDTLGYVDFTNGDNLAHAVERALPGVPLPAAPPKRFDETPLYVLKGALSTEGTIKMLSTLKKSRLGFRAYDPVETPRLSLHEARRQVSGSIGVVAHLLSPNRRDAIVHNALCAFVCGVAMAEQKVVVMLQEEAVPQPIDYRDVVQSYSSPNQIPQLLQKPILDVVQNMQSTHARPIVVPESALERLDLGDPAAENEIRGLRDYFVRTGPFRQAFQGHGRLVVGRKGTGKTAIFYEIRGAVGRSKSTLVLDLKPEGHQFTKLREAVLSELPQGVREHTVTAFWNYILLSEIAHKIVQQERRHATLDHMRQERFDRLERVYLDHAVAQGDDLSQRLLRQVERIAERFGEVGPTGMRDHLTEVMYTTDIRTLDDAVSDYLQEKDAVWLLIDNLDKSWATRGTTPEDILIVLGLLDATRKLQRQLEERDVDFNCLVFIRTDVYEHLVRETPDRDKDTAIRVDWDDPAVLQEMMRRRISSSTDVDDEDFAHVWRVFFASHVGAEESFGYMLDRTFMRPRDLLKFAQRAIEVALNRNHQVVTSDDIQQAESAYSEDMLLMTSFEIEDTLEGLGNALFRFQGAPRALTLGDAGEYLRDAGIAPDALEHAIEMLVWFGVLGVAGEAADEDKYAYQVRYNVRQLLEPVLSGRARFVIHPAFRSALRVRP
jgi:hypothetical protein